MTPPTAARSAASRTARHTLAADYDDRDVGLWDTGGGQRTATLAEGSPVSSLAFSPDGHTLAVGDLGEQVGQWDTVTGTRTATLARGQRHQQCGVQPGRPHARGRRR